MQESSQVMPKSGDRDETVVVTQDSVRNVDGFKTIDVPSHSV